MKIGVLLPTFEEGPAQAFTCARAVAAAGLDGVFAYDHLWPMNSPRRPSLAPFPLLATLVRRHEQLTVGPLVARVGLVGTSHLVDEFLTLHELSGGRVIAAIGTGDRLSAAENEAYGLPKLDAAQRRALLYETADALRTSMPVWLGAGAPTTNELARSLEVTLNYWDAPVEKVREAAALGLASWAGPAPRDLDGRLSALAAAGATWAVLGPSVAISELRDWRRRHPLSKLP